jgi:restriction system protein
VEEMISLNDHEKQTLEKTGYVRWQSILHFYSIDCVKAGYLKKDRGVWILTDKGEEAIKLGSADLLKSAQAAYRKWKKEQEPQETLSENEEQINLFSNRRAGIDKLEADGLESLREYLKSKNPYEFQDMVAYLLKSMGYHISFVAPKGKDGGIDIIAYQDPLGVNSPRIKVQVKHIPESPIAVKDIRSLIGLLHHDSDVGLFVTTGSFSKEAKDCARNSQIHVELIDFGKFINLWEEYYSKMSDEEKNTLPLKPIFFLGANE